jgi:hypothetical protein
MEGILLKLIQVQTAFARNHNMMMIDGGGGSVVQPGGFRVTQPGGGRGSGDIRFDSPLGNYGNFQEVLGRVINGLVILANPVVVIMILWAGYQFIVSGGSPDKVTKARQTILWTVVGYGILLLASGITAIIQQLLLGSY